MEYSVEELLSKIKQLAEQHNVAITDNAEKIAKARVLTKCDLDKCICDRDDAERGCISAKCMKEIQETGMCHCRCYKLKD